MLENPNKTISMKQRLMHTHPAWGANIETWQFLIDSYLGGKNFRDGKYLTNYAMESQEDYESRLDSTPYDNHVKAIVNIYNSFLFREPPEREMGSLENDPALDAFMKDCDLDGRSFSAVMRDISTYANVYGHTWVILDKPPTNAYTRAEELNQGIRPYISIITPENVLDWRYERAISGYYELVYLKIYEGHHDGIDTIRIYKPDTVEVWEMGNTEPNMKMEMPNQLGRIPAVCVYGQRSPVRGVGVSLVGDVASMARAIYNELSEIEQVGRLTNHPSLVKTADTQAAAGAGSIIQMPHDMDPQLKPYLLQPTGSSLDGFLKSLEQKVQSIDRMAHMGGIRSIETRRLSGVALATEFQLLNASLAALADNLEHAEEQIWRLYAQWQGMVWDGEVNYPDSFNIQDKYNDMNMLKLAKDAGPRSDILHKVIEEEMLKILVDEDEYEEYKNMVDVSVTEVTANPPSTTPAPGASEEIPQEGEVEDFNGASCPVATQDVAVNLANRQTAIDSAHYGPLNPNQPNKVFWMALADKWSVTEEQAQASRCGNCAAFNQTSAIKNCIEQGLAAGGATGNEWDTVNAGDLGYCEAFDFKCASNRTCDAWIVGGPITD